MTCKEVKLCLLLLDDHSLHIVSMLLWLTENELDFLDMHELSLSSINADLALASFHLRMLQYRSAGNPERGLFPWLVPEKS